MAAAFERARAALDKTPPLSSTVESVLQRCGSRADLLLESEVNFSQPVEPLEIFIKTRKNMQEIRLDMTLLCRPLLAALQQGGDHCALCSPLGRLLIQNIEQSGSSMEGFMPVVVGGGVTKTSSDVDIMLQMGPVAWEKTDAVCGVSQEGGAGSVAAHSPTGADSGQQDDQAVPRLRVVPTENPGFLLLYQVKREQCTHPDEHLFSGDPVRQIIHRFTEAAYGHWFNELNSSGPATSFGQQRAMQFSFDGFDLVPCLRANWWPSEEFFQRSRARDWPPAAARDDIRQFGIHLVPIGAKGSSTELHEWRLSFSRPEVVVAWHLLPSQSSSLVGMKICKTALGPEGKPLKSYYMKTALFWLCQDSDVKQWTSIEQGMDMIIDFLERAIDARYLGCFFWSEINLFRQSSAADLAAMRHTLSLLRRSMTRLLAHQFSGNIETQLAQFILACEPFQKLSERQQELSERQLRACLARRLVLSAVLQGVVNVSSHPIFSETLVIKMFHRSLAATELALVLHNYHQQNQLFLALTVAPADVMARCRLTSLDDVMFRWDAAPLIDLLTLEDLKGILGDPVAIHAWLKDQHRLPTGLRSLRELTDLLLNPSLLSEALRESVPWMWEAIQRKMQKAESRQVVVPMSFDGTKMGHLKVYDHRNTLAVFERLPRHGTQSARCQYRQFREEARQFLDDPQTSAEYDRLRHRLMDPWRLRQFVFTDSQ